MAHLLVRAARGEAVERVPVWAMRQAGRWDPEFRRVRDGAEFFAFSRDVRGSTAATLCPRRFGVDGIILFYDITTLPLAMGLDFALQPNRGPMPAQPIRTMADVDRLTTQRAAPGYGYIRELLASTKAELRGELPVLVFAGSPFTVATYCIGTGKDMAATRRFIAERPEVWERLLHVLADATVEFLRTLIADGADMYQLFDSWAGMLTEAEYQQQAQPYHRMILNAATGVPRVLFVKECPYLKLMAETGADVVSLGLQHDLAAARLQYPNLVFQGNVDEAVLRTGTPEQVRAAVKSCLQAGGGYRHILNLNHGVGKQTPPENFAAFIAAAKGE